MKSKLNKQEEKEIRKVLKRIQNKQIEKDKKEILERLKKKLNLQIDERES